MVAKKRKRKAAEEPPIPANKPYEDTVNRLHVDRPVQALVGRDMTNMWAISKRFPMAILFDAVSPLRRFKRGTDAR